MDESGVQLMMREINSLQVEDTANDTYGFKDDAVATADDTVMITPTMTMAT